MHAYVTEPHFEVAIKVTVDRQVRLRRIEVGISQQVLADRCGFFRTYLSRIENGSANPTIIVLAKLAVSLEVDIAEFFRDS